MTVHCRICSVPITEETRLDENMDPFNVYLCELDQEHFVIVDYYSDTVYYDFISKIVEASMSQPLSQRVHREVRVPDVAGEVIPKLLRHCSCGGRYLSEWSLTCRPCAPQALRDRVLERFSNSPPFEQDIWIEEVEETLKKIARAWDIDLSIGS